MRRSSFMVIAGLAIELAGPALAQTPLEIGLQLNRIEETSGKCRIYMVMQDRSGAKLQSLKADIIVFQKDGAISKRLSAELGPVRPRKTTVKIFDLAMPCLEVSGLLLNDVLSCGPGHTPEECLDSLEPSSRLPISFIK